MTLCPVEDKGNSGEGPEEGRSNTRLWRKSLKVTLAWGV